MTRSKKMIACPALVISKCYFFYLLSSLSAWGIRGSPLISILHRLKKWHMGAIAPLEILQQKLFFIFPAICPEYTLIKEQKYIKLNNFWLEIDPDGYIKSEFYADFLATKCIQNKWISQIARRVFLTRIAMAQQGKTRVPSSAIFSLMVNPNQHILDPDPNYNCIQQLCGSGSVFQNRIQTIKNWKGLDWLTYVSSPS